MKIQLTLEIPNEGLAEKLAKEKEPMTPKQFGDLLSGQLKGEFKAEANDLYPGATVSITVTDLP